MNTQENESVFASVKEAVDFANKALEYANEQLEFANENLESANETLAYANEILELTYSLLEICDKIQKIHLKFFELLAEIDSLSWIDRKINLVKVKQFLLQFSSFRTQYTILENENLSFKNCLQIFEELESLHLQGKIPDFQQKVENNSAEL